MIKIALLHFPRGTEGILHMCILSSQQLCAWVEMQGKQDAVKLNSFAPGRGYGWISMLQRSPWQSWYETEFDLGNARSIDMVVESIP